MLHEILFFFFDLNEHLIERGNIRPLHPFVVAATKVVTPNYSCLINTLRSDVKQ